MTDALVIEPHALNAEAANGSSAAVDIGITRSCVALRLQVNVLSGGTPTLDVTVEHAPTVTGPWQTLGAFARQTAPGTSSLTLADSFEFVRVSWVLGSGASATFRVSGLAHVLYASIADVVNAFPAKALINIPVGVQGTACLSATDEAATYLSGRFTLPLISWSTDITRGVAKMAAFQMMTYRGFQPQGTDELIVKGNDDAVAYFKAIMRNELYPPGVVDQDPADVGVTDAYIVQPATSQWDDYGGNFSDPTFGDPLTRG